MKILNFRKNRLMQISALAAVALFLVAAVQPVPESRNTLITEILTLSADAAAVDFDTRVRGSYLYQVEVFASADDAVTFTINSELGTELFTTTTTAATSGEISLPNGFYAIPQNRTPNYTLAGLGSGTVTVEVTFVKK